MTNPNKTVILEKQARQSILTGLLKANPSIGDTTFVSLNVFLNSFVKDERNADWFQAVAILQKEADQYPTLKEILKFPITADHLLEFIKTMADEGWHIQDLPDDGPKNHELKLILNHLVPIFDRRKKQWDAIESINSFQHVSVYDHFYSYPISRRLHTLKERGMRLVDLPQQDPDIKVRYAKNPRSEAQACVQMIVSDAMPYDDQVIVCLDQQLQNQVESFLIRYEVPYFRVNEHKTNSAFRLIGDLLSLKFDTSQKALLRLIQNDKLRLTHRLDVVTYLETFGFDAKACLEPLTHVQKTVEDGVLKEVIRIKDYVLLEQQAEEGLRTVRDVLKKLEALDASNFKTFITGLFDLYVSLFEDFSDEDVESINKVKSVIEEGTPSLETMREPYEALLYAFSKLTLSTKQATGVILTDLKHAHIPGKKRIFFLSCTQDHYPQLPTAGGLFDDDYLRKVSPLDQQARYDHHMNHLMKLQKSADEIIYSYPMGSYEGKAKKLPYELDWFFEKNGIGKVAWPLVETDNETSEEQYKLDSAISSQLYFEGGVLKGSISSFEKYFHCPYQYYLAAGLKLKEPPRFGIDNAIMGTLLHLVLEKAIAAVQKDYVKQLMNHEGDALKPYFEALKRLFIQRADELEIMFERTVVMLHLCLEFLDSREMTSPFTRLESEREYNETIPLGEGKSVFIHGYIDRIDSNDSGFMIIDYKSSTKKLAENFVQRGIQLQLLTYLWMGHQYLKLGTPYGAYYFSLGQTNGSIKAYRYLMRDGVVPVKDPQEQWFSGRRFNGWPTLSQDQLDPTGSHVVTKAQYDIDKIETLMLKKYTELYDGLQNGQISKQNVAGSCKYCAFRSFCQFKGEEKKLPAIKKKEDSILLYKEGE